MEEKVMDIYYQTKELEYNLYEAQEELRDAEWQVELKKRKVQEIKSEISRLGN
jgi:hypothetical protein